MPAYFALLLALEATMIGVFAAQDVFLFYVFFEVMLVPMYFLIGSYGGHQKQYAAVKFFLYSLVGGLFMLAAVVGLWVARRAHLRLADAARPRTSAPTPSAGCSSASSSPSRSRRRSSRSTPGCPTPVARRRPARRRCWSASWTRSARSASCATACRCSPTRRSYFAPLALTLALVGIIYGALLAIGQNDLKRLVSYTSIAHFGFIGIGIFAFTTQAGTGAVLYMVNHGLATGLLFLVVGMLVSRRGSALVSDFGGAGKLVPVLAGVFFFAGLASLALPGTSPFVSEFLVLIGTFTVNKTVAVIATAGIILAAGYVLWMIQRTTQGTTNPKLVEIKAMSKDLSLREAVVVTPLIALILRARLLPEAGIDVINPAVKATHARHRQVTDPKATAGDTWRPASERARLQLPNLDYAALSPMLILFGAACLGVLSRASCRGGCGTRVQLSAVAARPRRRAGRW